jgi:hypothetical protein
MCWLMMTADKYDGGNRKNVYVMEFRVFLE